MKPILEIISVSKKFRLRHQQESYLSLREKLTPSRRRRSAVTEDFYALKDVTFDVARGESVGIIGRNGAGKSTLLKILSKITPPSAGLIITRGRIASLLEVGTGFHPELTGRENVYLNGSILGMKKRTIDTLFDEIVDFAGTERFLDTALKHYSSGMQLRLAFAVAAFLEPEILVIDEVLAVGDAEFQKKCLRKMEDVRSGGRTILFVSHNMSAVEGLCAKSVLLQNGTVQSAGATGAVIRDYMNLIDAGSTGHQGVIITPPGGTITKVEVLCDGRNTNTAYTGCRLDIKVHFKSKDELDAPVLGVIIRDSQNAPVIGVNNKHYIRSLTDKPVTEGCITMTIPYLSLFEDAYHIDIHFGNAFSDIQVLRDCFQLIVEPMMFTSSGEMPDKKLNKFFIRDVSWSLSQSQV